MTAVEAWKQNQPPALAMLAEQAILAAPECCQMLSGDESHFANFAPPRLEEREEWLSFWSNDLLKVNSSLGLTEELTVSLPRDSELDKLGPFLNAIAETVDHKAVSFDSLFESLFGRFVGRVVLPCWLSYQRSPASLLREVIEKHDFNLLEFLLSLDKALIHHPNLHAILHPADAKIGASIWELLNKAMTKPRPSIIARKVKYLIAAIIQHTAELMGSQLDCPDIQALFDAVAKDKGELRDSDLPATPDSFYKGVSRELKHLRSLTNPDKQPT